MDARLRRTIIHEAGHVIAAHAADIPIIRVAVYNAPGEGPRGLTSIGGDWASIWASSSTMRRPTAIRHMIRVTMAGAEAEGILLGDIGDADRQDQRDILRLLEALRAARSYIPAHVMRAQTRAILGQRRRQLQRLVDALALRPILTGVEVEAAIHGRL